MNIIEMTKQLADVIRELGREEERQRNTFEELCRARRAKEEVVGERDRAIIERDEALEQRNHLSERLERATKDYHILSDHLAATEALTDKVVQALMRTMPEMAQDDCADVECRECTRDHDNLNRWFEQVLGGQADYLSRYRSWLDKSGIRSDHAGWLSKEARDPENIQRFVFATMKEG